MASILIVDDSYFSRSVLKKAIALTEHHIVAEAVNGEEAIQLYSQWMPDLVILDVNMPIMNGMVTLKEMIRLYPDAKIVMCSSMGQQRMIIEAIQEGAKDFIVKPYDPERVTEALIRTLYYPPGHLHSSTGTSTNA